MKKANARKKYIFFINAEITEYYISLKETAKKGVVVVDKVLSFNTHVRASVFLFLFFFVEEKKFRRKEIPDHLNC